MCFFNSLTVNAAVVAKKYGKGMDIIETVRRLIAEQEPNAGLEEEVYTIPAYTEPQCVIVSGSTQLEVMQWGLIPHTASVADRERYGKENWFKNARAEEIFATWPYRLLIYSQRCIIPSTGYYEYHYDDKGKTQPYFIYLKDREVFSMAGLWNTWINPETGEQVKSFVQITTAANPFVASIHNGGKHPGRQPLILNDEDTKKWLDEKMTGEEEIKRFLKPYPEYRMAAHPVSKNFRSMNPKLEDLIKPH